MSKYNNKKIKKISEILAITLSIFIITYFGLGGLLHNLDSSFLPFIKEKVYSKLYANKNIIVVEIDDKSCPLIGGCPIVDRATYGPVLDNLKTAGALAVGMDIFFADKRDEKTDAEFAQKIKDNGNVILGADINQNTSLVPPLEIFKNAAKNIGYYQPFIDKKNGEVFSIEPFKTFENSQNIESFSLAILRVFKNNLYLSNNYEITSEQKKDSYNFMGDELPTGKVNLLGKESKLFYINYIKSNQFKKISYIDVYNNNFDSDLFKDKIVLIGYTAEGVKDEFRVPGLGIIKGVYVHANVINNILNKNYTFYFNKNVELIIVFLGTLTVIYLTITFSNTQSFRWLIFGGFTTFLSISIVYFALYIFFVGRGIYITANYPVEFLVIIFLSFFTSSVYKYLNEDRNKEKLSSALSQYVSSDIAASILTGDGILNQNGERKKIAIFFSDIEGFTTISEKLSPEELVSFLREYLGEMSSIIMNENGFINKYEGDAIMALWGVFGTPDIKDSYYACISAIKQQKDLLHLNQKWKEAGFKTNFNVRMGIHTGDAIVGNIGAIGRKMEFTALGDSVNLGSRLEGVNKFYGTYVCVSEVVYEENKEYFDFRYLDKIRVKGKNIPINIYELICIKGELSDYKNQIITEFEKAMKFYLNKDFAKALEIFEKNKALDNPSKVYTHRCDMYLQNPPQENWDGVWTMEEK